MAQHDYVIDNSTGANVRADINNALLAISSNNSGSSAPSTTYALQSFANTTDSMLQLRNAANNAFVNLRKFDGTLPLPDGSAASPSLFFDDDTNTGLFSSAADTFNVATGGVERMELGTTTIFNEDGADVDFRIEGNAQANLFFIDAGDKRIGISSGSPIASLHVVDSGTSGDGTVAIGGTGTNASATLFYEISGTTYLRIKNLYRATSSAAYIEYDAGHHRFTTGTSGNEAMRLDSGGRLGIGTSSPSSYNSSIDDLVIQGPSNQGITIATTDTSSLCQIGFADGTSGDAAFKSLIRYDHGSDAFVIFSGGFTERFRINSSGFFQYNNATDIGGVFQLTANGVTNLSGNKLARFNFNSTGDVTAIEMRHARGGLSGFNGKMISFTGNDGTEEGSINIHLASVAYNTSSDYRLKENEVAISDGITKLKQLKPYRFNFKKDPDVKVDGFFAHEVAPVVPVAVTGEKDAMEAETRYEEGDTIPEGKVIGDPKTYSTTKISPQQIDHSKLVPILVAAVQELIGKVEALEAA